jgi:hypothetical protein
VVAVETAIILMFVVTVVVDLKKSKLNNLKNLEYSYK